MTHAIRRFEPPCEPPWWAKGGHAQTWLGHFLPSEGEPLSRNPERLIELGDGDRLVVHVVPGSSGVRAHLWHGYAGDVDSDYIRRAARALAARGHEVWAVNHRGCGVGAGLARRLYHSGRVDDLRAVLAESRAEAPDRRHVLIGFSMSGNIALLHAADRAEPRLDGIVAINPPTDLDRTTRNLHLGLNRLYELRLLARLRKFTRALELGSESNVRARDSVFASQRQFDEIFVAPICGFADAQDYYRRCSSSPRLADIDTPTVILAAEDDPLVDVRMLREAKLSGSVCLHIEPTGGHMGYLAREGMWFRRWLDDALVHYVEELAGFTGRLADTTQ